LFVSTRSKTLKGKSNHNTTSKEAKPESPLQFPHFLKKDLELLGFFFLKQILFVVVLLFVAANFAGSQIHLFLVGIFAKLQDKKPWLLW